MFPINESVAKCYLCPWDMVSEDLPFLKKSVTNHARDCGGVIGVISYPPIAVHSVLLAQQGEDGNSSVLWIETQIPFQTD